MNTSEPKIKVIIGLGNPDRKYQHTYHNVGHLFIDYLNSHQSLVADHMLKSDVYMNESGKFVAKKMKIAGAKTEELLIAQDDSDIQLGEYKISFNRGAAGHHGIESVQQHLGNKFWRLRIGIRPPAISGRPRKKAGEFVLKKISAKDEKTLKTVFEKVLLELKN